MGARDRLRENILPSEPTDLPRGVVDKKREV
ncbi:hypothetical protein M3J09_008943 [Ascochyta lentis]